VVALAGEMAQVTKVCGNKGCTKDAAKFRCGQCHGEDYCSKECQVEHWKNGHKEACALSTKPESAVLTRSFKGLSAKQLNTILTAKSLKFTEKKKALIRQQMQGIEKDELLKLVEEHVEPSEIEALLTPASTAGSSSSGEGSSSSSSSRNRQSSSSSGRNGNQRYGGGGAGGQQGEMRVRSQEELKQQAAEIRKNPQMFRNSNAAFKELTDQQVFEMADNLEATASDPKKYEEMVKSSKKHMAMPQKTQDLFTKIQFGLMNPTSLNKEWITAVTSMLKSPKELKFLKELIAGNSKEDQSAMILQCIDYASKMEKAWLEYMLNALVGFVNPDSPLRQWYKWADEKSFGLVKYVLGFILLVIVYYLLVLAYYVLKNVFLLVYYGISQIYKLVANSSSKETTATSVPLTPASSSSSAAASAKGGSGGKDSMDGEF